MVSRLTKQDAVTTTEGITSILEKGGRYSEDIARNLSSKWPGLTARHVRFMGFCDTATNCPYQAIGGWKIITPTRTYKYLFLPTEVETFLEENGLPDVDRYWPDGIGDNDAPVYDIEENTTVTLVGQADLSKFDELMQLVNQLLESDYYKESPSSVSKTTLLGHLLGVVNYYYRSGNTYATGKNLGEVLGTSSGHGQGGLQALRESGVLICDPSATQFVRYFPNTPSGIVARDAHIQERANNREKEQARKAAKDAQDQTVTLVSGPDEIRKYKKLWDDGLITEDQYNKRKDIILSSE